MSTSSRERELVLAAIARLRAGVMAIVFGLVGALGLFLATAVLLVEDGENMGQHLGRLGWYLPGYEVTWAGAALGGLYGLLLGATVGWTVAFVYNRIAGARGPT